MPSLNMRRLRARFHRRRGHTLGELVTRGSPKEIRTACANIKCAQGRICYCEAFVNPPDCWCGDVITYKDGSTNADATSIKELAQLPTLTKARGGPGSDQPPPSKPTPPKRMRKPRKRRR